MDDAARLNFQFQKIIAVVGVTLMVAKFIAYHLTGSVAILTDALESIVNVVAGFVGLYALYISAIPADKDHPFGHGKIENISATIEGAMILFAGILIIYESILSILNPGQIKQLDIGIIVVAVAALVNYVVGRTAIRKGTKSRSPALVASGKHLCSDTYSTVGIIIGLIAMYIAIGLGFDAQWLDPAIAIIFGVIIGYTGLKVLKQCFGDSMDKIDPELLEDITEALNEYRHEHWIDVYRLRLIKYGPCVFVDLHIVLPKNMTVEDTYNEKEEINEVMSSKFGLNVETSMTAVPCNPRMCRYCMMECDDRKCIFEKQLTWNSDMLLEKNMHIPNSIIEIDDCINPKC